MQKIDTLIRTKLHMPFTRMELVLRPRLQERIAEGVRGPLTLITAPAGFGKTTLLSSYIADRGMILAWLSLDKEDNQVRRFLTYLVAALQEAGFTIGEGAIQLLKASDIDPPEAILTSLINDLDVITREVVLVLDDYQFISNQAVHEEVAFLIEHCPTRFHLVIVTRSDPPLPLARLRARGQIVELRAADLRFTESEAAQFLNKVMGLDLDAKSVAALTERTEGWVAGLQMTALSIRDREDVNGFIEGFSGTNRYILDYLLEEVLATQPPEIQYFLFNTSILRRLTAPLCDAVLADENEAVQAGDDRSTSQEPLFASQSTAILEYLERANLFLVPLDDERTWYRYHHLFADLLRAQLRRTLDEKGVAQLHQRASEWHGQNGSIPEAIHHASLASDDERVERFIEQSYRELVRRGEQSWLRLWVGKLSKELVHSRPWLCMYEAYSHSWYGELDEAESLLDEAEKRIQSEISKTDTNAMQGLLAYVRSRVTALRGEIDRAIKYCVEAREYVAADNLALQLDTLITLGYEYFLKGDYYNAIPTLKETIRIGTTTGAVINTVAASCVLARLYAFQGQLKKSCDTLQKAAHSIPEESGQHLSARALVEIGIAEVLCEWNELEAALVHMQEGINLLTWWGKADDYALAYVTLARIHLAQAKMNVAVEAIEKALQLIQTRGVFCEARNGVEIALVKLWLAQGDFQAVNRWAESQMLPSSTGDRCAFEHELTYITRARVLIAQNEYHKAIDLLTYVEETARSAGRMGRVLEISILKALAFQKEGDTEHACLVLAKCLELAEPEGYVRIFLDEGQPMRTLLSQWLEHHSTHPMQNYARRLLSKFDAELAALTREGDESSPTGDPVTISIQVLVEPLSSREVEVLQIMAEGRTNQEIAQQLIISPGTVKAHAASIYRKLDVANRTEAVARARQLGILP